MYKVCCFVPENSSEAVKLAMFNAGAGRIGNYEHCSFEVKGVGQFKAMKGANPAIGSVGELEKVVELKIEMVCADHLIKEVISAMKGAHPYEMPAYDVFKMEDL